MESPTAFDLNQAIHNWRNDLAQSPAFQSGNLCELETHLRDSIADLQQRGLTAEESFLIARNRLGGSRPLASEYGRINRNAIWWDRLLWMLVGIQVWGLTSGFIDSIARNAFAIGWRGLSHNPEVHGMVLPITLFTLTHIMAFAASVVLCWWIIYKKGDHLRRWIGPWFQRRGSFVALCVVLCAVAFSLDVFSSGLSALLFWISEPQVVGEAMMYSSYSQLWVSPFQIAAMVVAILLLARSRMQRVGAWAPE